ncbi:MAG: amidohydrolase family protein [bacterium]
MKNLHLAGLDKEKKDIKIYEDIILEINSAGVSNYINEDAVLDLKNCIAFPGLINSHDHLEFNLYPQLGHNIYSDYVEWGDNIHQQDKEVIKSIEAIPVELRMKYGIIKNLLCGVTAVAHHGTYNYCLHDAPITVIKNYTSIHSVRLGNKWKLKLKLNWIKNLEPYVIHIGEGINAESFEEINELIRWNLFKRKTIGVHGISMTEKQSKNFEAVVWCPVSNFFLFNKTADINSLKEKTKVLFGTDSTLTAEWNFWEHLRKARKLNLLCDTELLASVTSTAADVWGLTNSGNISKGTKADIVIAKQKADNLFDSFFQTDPEDILIIIKNGKVILYDESLKELLCKEIKQLNNFYKIDVHGKTKFVNYNITEIIKEIKKYNSSISLLTE